MNVLSARKAQVGHINLRNVTMVQMGRAWLHHEKASDDSSSEDPDSDDMSLADIESIGRDSASVRSVVDENAANSKIAQDDGPGPTAATGEDHICEASTHTGLRHAFVEDGQSTTPEAVPIGNARLQAAVELHVRAGRSESRQADAITVANGGRGSGNSNTVDENLPQRSDRRANSTSALGGTPRADADDPVKWVEKAQWLRSKSQQLA